MGTQQAPARRVIPVTAKVGDASDASRGVTRTIPGVTREMTRKLLASLFASPLPARHDAVEPFSVTRVTRNAGHRYPPYFRRGWGARREGLPERAPAVRVIASLVAVSRTTRLTDGELAPSWLTLVREGGAK